MKNPTLRELYRLGLSEFGYVREETTSRKYWLLSKRGASPTYFWLGSSGAVRFASIRRIDASIAASDKTKAKILERGREKMAILAQQADETNA